MPAAWREPSGPGKGLGGLAAFEAPALVAGLDDLAMVSEPVEQRCRHLGVTEHRWPFAEREVGGDDDRGLLVKSADQVEQQLATRHREQQIAELVQDHEIEPVEMIGDTALPPGAGLGLEPVGQIDRVLEPDASTATHAGTADRDRQNLGRPDPAIGHLDPLQ